jgi:sugar-specific transcriptional regulator TrmB
MLEESSDGTKSYTALPVNVFLEQAREKWTNTYNHVEKQLKAIESQDRKDDTYVSTVRGEKNILAFCRNLMRDAKEKVIISIWDTMYLQLVTDLKACVDRGCSVSGITFQVENPISNLDKHRINKVHNSIDKKKWFILSVDSKELLYGHSSEFNSNAFYTDDTTHIYLLEDYIFHDVLVNRVLEKENKQQEAIKLISDILSDMRMNF